MADIKRQTRTLRSDPVDLQSGALIDARTDIVLGGLVPFALICNFASDQNIVTPAGRNIISSLDIFIEKTKENRLNYHTGNGFEFEFDRPTPGPGLWMPADKQPNMQLLAGEKRSYHLKEGSRTTHFGKFADGKWRPISIKDMGNAAIYISHDKAYRPIELTFPEGLKITFSYNAQGFRETLHLVSRSGGKKLFAHYEYDSEGNLVSVNRPFDSSFRYEYDEKGRRIFWSDSKGSWGKHLYDDQDRVIRVETNGPHNGDKFEYDTENYTTRFLPGGDPEKAVTTIFDEEGNVLEECDALGHIKTSKYVRSSLLAETTNAEGETNKYAYDFLGNLTSITDGEGRENNVFYDQHSRPDLIMDPEGNAWRYEYDLTGGVATVIDPLKHRTDIVNNDLGQPIKIMRHDGYMEQRAYDDHHQLIGIMDFKGGKTYLKRDDFGRVVSITDPLGNKTQITYEEQLGRDFFTASKIIRSDGVEVSSYYTEKNVETSNTDGERRTSIYRHGPFDLLKEIEDPKGGLLRFAYDGQERLERVTNQKGLHWTFERDEVGRVIKETDFDGLELNYDYDKVGRLIRKNNPDGSRSEYSYDKSSLLIEMSNFAAGSDEAEETVSYAYDDNGRLEITENSISTVVLKRDGLGRIISETQNDQAIESTFDCCGNRVQRQIGEEITSFIYDPLGDLIQMQIADHDPLEFTRDIMGQELERVSGAGFMLRQEWDKIGQLTGQKAGRIIPKGIDGAIEAQAAGGLAAYRSVERGYHWSRAYEPTAIKDQRWGETSYNYDRNGQVTSTRHGDAKNELFRYDKALNIDATGGQPTESINPSVIGSDPVYTAHISDYRSRDKQQEDISAKFFNWQSSKGGRVEHATDPKGEKITLNHDGLGRVIERRIERKGFRPKVQHMKWNVQDQLVAVKVSETESWRYGYDSFGRRVYKEKILKIANNGRKESSEQVVQRTDFLWDGDVLASETRTHPSAQHEASATARRQFSGALAKADAPASNSREREQQRTTTHWYFEPNSFRPLAKRELETAASPPKQSVGDLVQPLEEELLDPTNLKHGDPVSFSKTADAQENLTTPVIDDLDLDTPVTKSRLWYVITDHLGTPRELLSEDGQLVWAAEYTTWGSIRRLWQADNDNDPTQGAFQGYDPDGNPVYTTRWQSSGNLALKPLDVPDPSFCPIRFQGQWEDEETGLYYNRFRYYDSLAAQYLSPDPIGLAGGYKSHGYVELPLTFSDPLGLMAFGSGAGKHTAVVTVCDQNGNIRFQDTFQSGDMTADEAALGFPQNSLATHTEARAVRQIPLAPGERMIISGEYPPCPTCKGKMNQAVAASGAFIEYIWPDANTGEMKSWTSGCCKGLPPCK